MLRAIRDAFVVVGAGARLWLRHWPVLLTLALFALAARAGAIWAAVRLSDINNTTGILTLVLAPLAAVTGIVLMLYTLRHSLPALRDAATVVAPQDVVRHRERRLLDMLASVLVPFLAVYASYGYLKEDIDRFMNTVFGEEFAQNDYFAGASGLGNDVSRFDIGNGWVTAAVVAIAIVLKFGLAKLEGRRAWIGFAFLGAYVEVLWLATIAVRITTYKDTAWAWAQSRRGVEMFVDGWEAALDRLGPLAGPVDTAGAWTLDLIASVDSLVIVPVAWLTVGAVVYGHKLIEQPAPPEPRILRVVPGPVKRAGAELFGEVAERFTGLLGGLRQLAVAGLAPMLIFGLAFLASQRLEDGLYALGRLLLGPQAASPWLAFSPHIEILTRAVGLSITMCLLAAAVERVLASGGTTVDEPEGSQQPVPDAQGV
ncbi:hypothetical protein [Kineosporia sp. NBRC 101731]|uniref:hypothetical protein n=1 Tax=Kineosporia sp. NBRC 101731 TaxID=3032199 RepID=UPI0024A17B3F|nr:hypothetical protein [Kineosporia sp. NBRC 101731]GLY32979.1 hypothetical protein Kisp02_63440 [Kineosporia sp. NBRC 101731]